MSVCVCNAVKWPRLYLYFTYVYHILLCFFFYFYFFLLLLFLLSSSADVQCIVVQLVAAQLHSRADHQSERREKRDMRA